MATPSRRAFYARVLVSRHRLLRGRQRRLHGRSLRVRAPRRLARRLGLGAHCGERVRGLVAFARDRVVRALQRGQLRAQTLDLGALIGTLGLEAANLGLQRVHGGQHGLAARGAQRGRKGRRVVVDRPGRQPSSGIVHRVRGSLLRRRLLVQTRWQRQRCRRRCRRARGSELRVRETAERGGRCQRRLMRLRKRGAAAIA
jgi:hypothetical protein